jgi:hypothetical protein
MSREHLGADDKDTITRQKILKTWKLKISLTASESSSRKSARFMQEY